MSQQFERMLTDSVSLVKTDGRQYDGIKAFVQPEMIFIADETLPIEEGDKITRQLPNGLIESYLILERGYMSPVRGIDAHYQVKVRKETTIPKRESPTTTIGTFIAGDQFNQSGDFRGANIKSALIDVNQTINNIPNVNQSNKDKLKNLMIQLEEALGQVPPESAEEAEAVAEMAKALIESVSKEKPNKTMVEITGEGLKKAAKNIASVSTLAILR
jgi:hypothetical protein